MREINKYTSAVAASIEQQSAATCQISSIVTHAAEETKVVGAVLGKVNEAATHTSRCGARRLAGGRSRSFGAAHRSGRFPAQSGGLIRRRRSDVGGQISDLNIWFLSFC